MPGHNYIFMPCRETWPGASIDARLPLQVLTDANGQPLTKGGKVKTIKPSRWLDLNRPVEQLTWVPGMPAIIHDRLVVDGGWIDRPGVQCLNLYRPPRLELGDAAEAQRWVDHVHKLYPQEAEHIIDWLAQRLQAPEIKINHALVFGGEEGIGKDTLLEPVKRAIGPWNFHEVSPTQMMGPYNGFVRSTILRINEARDLGETDRFKFYDHLKVYAAAPPDVLRVNEKFLREYYMFNCVGVVISTNYKTDGIYLAEQDRPPFRRLVRADQGRFHRRLFQRAVGLVRRRRCWPCCRLSDATRSHQLQSQATAAADRRLVGDRRGSSGTRRG
jgi:Family of unknown function (DUF5906)